MSDIVTVNIKGLAELQKKLEEQLPKDARLALRIALAAGGGDVKRAMHDAAPEEEGGQSTGFLKKHINVKTRLSNNGMTGRAFIGPSADAFYPARKGKEGSVTFRTRLGRKITFFSKHAGGVTAAMVARWLEFGTRKMHARPFMTEAWEKSKASALAHIIAKLKEQLKIS
jgi:HK97 gp10 family phage protein